VACISIRLTVDMFFFQLICLLLVIQVIPHARDYACICMYMHARLEVVCLRVSVCV
jgi:hypothetical protein